LISFFSVVGNGKKQQENIIISHAGSFHGRVNGTDNGAEIIGEYTGRVLEAANNSVESTWLRIHKTKNNSMNLEIFSNKKKINESNIRIILFNGSEIANANLLSLKYCDKEKKDEDHCGNPIEFLIQKLLSEYAVKSNQNKFYMMKGILKIYSCFLLLSQFCYTLHVFVKRISGYESITFNQIDRRSQELKEIQNAEKVKDKKKSFHLISCRLTFMIAVDILLGVIIACWLNSIGLQSIFTSFRYTTEVCIFIKMNNLYKD